ncbi:hypothetical protein BJY52DRAFT_1246868 [Lactarius psammicola]|nr:hypothetical protein BJY52DRAFT_1246868 [Lactarius psammicola]
MQLRATTMPCHAISPMRAWECRRCDQTLPRRVSTLARSEHPWPLPFVPWFMRSHATTGSFVVDFFLHQLQIDSCTRSPGRALYTALLTLVVAESARRTQFGRQFPLCVMHLLSVCLTGRIWGPIGEKRRAKACEYEKELRASSKNHEHFRQCRRRGLRY